MSLPDIQERALQLYQAPFRYDALGGYIWDARGEMVADKAGRAPVETGDWMAGAIAVLGIRGWGRIRYMENPQSLQDAVGELVAAALTRFWQETKR